jgi:hypothetical protein
LRLDVELKAGGKINFCLFATKALNKGLELNFAFVVDPGVDVVGELLGFIAAAAAAAAAAVAVA